MTITYSYTANKLIMKEIYNFTFTDLFLSISLVYYSCNKDDLHDQQNLQQSKNFIPEEKAIDIVSKLSRSKTTTQNKLVQSPVEHPLLQSLCRICSGFNCLSNEILKLSYKL